MIVQSARGEQRSRRVLVADDDPFYRDLASGALTDAGYEVVTAGDGKAALDLLASISIDLAIVDVQMPEMTGLEFIENVRGTDGYRHIPVIVITGQDDTESIERAYVSGATSFLAKPLNWPLFVQHVNFVLKAGQAEADLRDAIRTAEFMSDLKGRVASVLVGEFQAPLRTAQGMTELLRKEVYGPLGHRIYGEFAEDLHKALDQLNSIQLKMMNSSRAMSGELLLKEEDIPLKGLVQEVLHMLRPRADQRGIEIELSSNLTPNLLMKGDRSLLSQAFKMLVEGAIAASPRGSHIRVDARVDGDGGFNFGVEDSAPALPDSMVRDILGTVPGGRQVAQQASTSRNTGLTISRVVVEAHGGRMSLNSTIGEGSIIRLGLQADRVTVAGPEGSLRLQSLAASEEKPMFKSNARASVLLPPHPTA